MSEKTHCDICDNVIQDKSNATTETIWNEFQFYHLHYRPSPIYKEPEIPNMDYKICPECMKDIHAYIKKKVKNG